MAILTQHSQLPAGVIKSSFGINIVALIDTALPIVHDHIRSLKGNLPLLQRNNRYWVIAIPTSVFDLIGKTLTLNPANLGSGQYFGYTDYPSADNQFAALALSLNGKTVTTGLNGLGMIGVTQ